MLQPFNLATHRSTAVALSLQSLQAHHHLIALLQFTKALYMVYLLHTNISIIPLPQFLKAISGKHPSIPLLNPNSANLITIALSLPH